MRARSQVVRRVCEKLESAYGPPRLGNPEDPLDDLMYVLLSNKTPPKRAQATYAKLKEDLPIWDDVFNADPSDVISVLKPAGFAVKRTKQMQAILRKIREDFGACSLVKLSRNSQSETYNYLTSLPGVSAKIAKCVMMYTLGFDVLPVDVHVHRIARRLGWTKIDRPEKSHEELERLIPPERRYAFHVDCIAHGRALCHATNPKCDPCVIKNYLRVL